MTRLLADIARVAIVLFVVVIAAVAGGDGAGHEEQVFRRRGQRGAGGHHGEPEEVEHPEQRCAVRAELLEAQQDVRDLELLLSVLQELHQALPRALRQDASGHLHVQTVVAQNGVPLNLESWARPCLEAKRPGV